MSVAQRPHRVFVSFAHTDREFVSRLAADVRRAGVDLWVDYADLVPGTPDWEEAIREAVAGSVAVVLVASPASRQSGFVKGEMSLAAARRCPVIPVWASGEEWVDCVPLALAHAQYADCRGESYESGVSALVVRIKDMIARSTAEEESVPTDQTNLPQEITTFVGREAEIGAISRLLGASRLVTITGAGGIGKTRLALKVAAKMFDAFPDGVWLVELADLFAESLVPQEVATALGVGEEPGRAVEDELRVALKLKTLMLVLDNCEHLLAACADLAESLLRAAPGLTILATSRKSLGAPGEAVWPLSPLSLPRTTGRLGPEELLQYEAVGLFADRASKGKPTFAVTPQNAAAVAQLCVSLDGIPLAIEFAAARVRTFPPDQILRRLDEFLHAVPRDAHGRPRRHGTLHAAMNWSYSLLSDEERVALDRMSAFSGGWTVEAAEAVCGGEGIDALAVSDLLDRLVDASLVVVEDQPDGGARYRLLETVRKFATRRLKDSGDETRMRSAHARFFARIAGEAEQGIGRPKESESLARLEDDHDNLRAALQRLSRAPAEEASFLGMCAALGRFWESRSHFSEGLRWLEQAIAAAAEPEQAAYAKALYWAACLALCQGDARKAISLLESSLDLRRRTGDRRSVALALQRLGDVRGDLGEYALARRLYEECLALAREIDDQYCEALAVCSLGVLAMDEGRYVEAREQLVASLAIFRRLGDASNVVPVLHNLGDVAHRMGDFDSASTYLNESLELSRELGNRRACALNLQFLGKVHSYLGDQDRAEALQLEALKIARDLGDLIGIAYELESLACTAAARRQAPRAARLLGAAEGLREATGAVLPPSEREELVRGLQCAKDSLGVGWTALLEEGRAMSADEAVAFAEAAATWPGNP